jgi:hypothetical protein
MVVALVATALAVGCAVEPIVPDHPEDGGTWTDASSGSSSGASSSSSGALPPGDASSCQPGSVQTFQPGAYHPATAAWQGACATNIYDPIQLFYDQCLGGGATPSKCADFQKNNPACVACILTPASADHYGPLIDNGGFVTGNVAGCIELTDPGGLSCAKSVQALSACELASCSANCPVNDARSLDSYNGCAAQADLGGCAQYEAATSCTDTVADAGTDAARCFATDFQHFYYAVVPLFCGAPPPPSGGDASSEGGSGGSSSGGSSSGSSSGGVYDASAE